MQIVYKSSMEEESAKGRWIQGEWQVHTGKRGRALRGESATNEEVEESEKREGNDSSTSQREEQRRETVSRSRIGGSGKCAYAEGGRIGSTQVLAQ